MLSLALAPTVTVRLTVLALPGAVSEMMGGVVSLTIKDTGEESVVVPRLSKALAFRL